MPKRLALTLIVSLLLLTPGMLAGAQLAISGDEILALAWSPDGTRLAVGGGPDSCLETSEPFGIEILDVASGNVIYELAQHTCPVDSVAWSPDGTRLVSGSSDGTTVVWNVSTGQLVFQTPSVWGAAMTSLSWSSDNTQYAGIASLNSAYIWNAATGELENNGDRFDGGPFDRVDSLDWSRDGNWIAVGGYAVADINIWRADTLVLERTLTGHTEGVYSVKWSADSTKLASGDRAGEVRIWSAAGQLLKEFNTGSWVNNIAWHPDGAYIATGQENGVIVWDANTGSAVQSYPSSGRVYAVAWSPDGTRLVYGDNAYPQDGQIEFETTNFATTLITNVTAANGKAYARDLLNVGSTVYIDRTYTYTQIPADLANTLSIGNSTPAMAAEVVDQPLFEQTLAGYILDTEWNPSGSVLAAATANGVTLLNESLTVLSTFNTGVATKSLSWNADGSLLAVTAGNSLEIWSWNASSQAVRQHSILTDKLLVAVAWSNNDAFLATVGVVPFVDFTTSLGSITLWNGATFEVAGTYPEMYLIDATIPTAQLMDWTPSNQLVTIGQWATINDSYLVAQSDLSLFMLSPLPMLVSDVIPIFAAPDAFSVSVHPSSQLVAIGTDISMDIYNLDSLSYATSFPSGVNIFAVSWSPDGSKLIGDNVVFDFYGESLLGFYDGPSDVTSVSWHPGGSMVAIGSDTGNLRVEDLYVFPDFELTPTPIPATTPTPVPPALITNITASSGRTYQRGTLAVDQLPYTDRTYTFTQVPSALTAQEYIRTANADKALTGANFLTFTLSAPADVYVLWDNRYARPSWLPSSSWVDTGLTVTATDATGSLVRRVYRRSYPAGTVALNGNGLSQDVMYNVVVAPMP